jgi:hypothetical protein
MSDSNGDTGVKTVPVKIRGDVYTRLQHYKRITGRNIARTISDVMAEFLDTQAEVHIEVITSKGKRQ